MNSSLAPLAPDVQAFLLMRTLASLSLVTLLVAGCAGEDLSRDTQVSACGGFGQAAQALRADLNGDPATYCDAERLLWAYFEDTRTLELANNRILLNCCGEHDVDVALEAGVYVVTETDAPEFGDARCGCMCVYDYHTAIADVPAGQVDLRIIRDVTDSEDGPQLVWEGTIDTTTSTGAVEVETDDVEPWCGEGGD